MAKIFNGWKVSRLKESGDELPLSPADGNEFGPLDFDGQKLLYVGSSSVLFGTDEGFVNKRASRIAGREILGDVILAVNVRVN